MKIKYYDFSKTKSKLRNYEKNFLKVLEDDNYFEEKINKIREKLNIRKIKINVSEKTFDNLVHDFAVIIRINEGRLTVKQKGEFSSLIEFGNTIYLAISKLVDEYKLNSDWYFYLFTFILHNFIVFEPDVHHVLITDSDFVCKLSKDVKTYYPKIKFNPILLFVSKPINFTEFINECKRLWPKIDEALKKQEEVGNLRVFQKFNYKNIDIYKKIFCLRNKPKKKKFSEIAEILCDEHNESYSDSEIRVMYKRYKKIINDLKKT